MKDKPSSDSEASLRPLKSFEFESPRWWKQSGIPIIAIFVIVGFLYSQRPTHMRHGRNRADQSQAVVNARRIGLALHEFEKRFGQFPGEATVERVRAETSTGMKLGNQSSNAMFRQLFASGIVDNESMFYAKIAGSKLPDGNWKGDQALAKGECGFAYISGLKLEGDPSRPVALAPMIPGTDRFDYERFNGKAVVLRMDNSVTNLNIIKKTGRAKMNGKDILDPGNPIWAGEKWKLVWPE